MANISDISNSPEAADGNQVLQHFLATNKTSAGCLNPLAIPIVLQNAASWNTTGCLSGFLCQNNTAANTPEYCPPTLRCGAERLAQETCSQPQGDFEPFICSPGYYCPAGGKEQIECPARSFCNLGSFEPTPCAPGAYCPARSQRQFQVTPFVITLAIDCVFVLLAIVFYIKYKLANRRKKSFDALPTIEVEKADPMDDWDEPGSISGSDITSDAGSDVGTLSESNSHLQAFIDSLSRCIGAKKVGLSFGFHDLNYQPKKTPKPILSNVTGHISSGTLWGVMGASGAGKSTFVNVLMGKVKHTGGVTTVNGLRKDISAYKKIIGYVPQDDILLPELTVRENILHSARIRLPSNWTDEEIKKHVDILLSCVQLSHVQHSLVGSPARPVISGGQRKRVSIAMELAAAPMALFLDEPTSGLDATAAASIMALLKALSRIGITVITIIHQPRAEIYESLDSLLLLARGKMVYQGKTSEAQNYFGQLGFKFHPQLNPADVLIDIIAGEGHLYKVTSGEAGVPMLIEQWRQHQERTENDPLDRPISALSMEQNQALDQSMKRRGAYWHKQVYYCFVRSINQQIRQRSSFYLELLVGALAGFLIGLSSWNEKGILFRGVFQSPYEPLSSAIDYASVPVMGLLCALAIGLTASAPGVRIFGEEKLIYYREAASGHSRSAYYIGKVFSTFFRILLATLHFTVFHALLATPLMSFQALFAANLLYFYCVYGLASCISMVTRREDGPLTATIFSLIVSVFCGESPSLSSVSGWNMTWFWRACPGTWFVEGYFTENLSPLSYLYQIDQAASATGYTLGQFSLDLIMLFVLGTIYRLVAFAGLVLVNRSKQR